MNNNLQTKMKKGFTLFELLVSISIIAILIALASTSFSAAQKKARDSRRQEDMETVRKAAEQYYMLSNSNYPVSYFGAGTTLAVGGQTILLSWPSDPKGIGWTQYGSSLPASPQSGYCLCAGMEGRPGSGNSLNNRCSYLNIGGTGPYYCVTNQQ